MMGYGLTWWDERGKPHTEVWAVPRLVVPPPGALYAQWAEYPPGKHVGVWRDFPVK
jgi:hypothetical protein